MKLTLRVNPEDHELLYCDEIDEYAIVCNRTGSITLTDQYLEPKYWKSFRYIENYSPDGYINVSFIDEIKKE